MFASMSATSRPKKTALNAVHETPHDWHPADVVAKLRKAGWSLSRLSVAHDYHPRTLTVALHRPWPRGEKLIAAAIGLRPHAIWPTRYHADGRPKSGRGERIARQKDNSSAHRLQRAAA